MFNKTWCGSTPCSKQPGTGQLGAMRPAGWVNLRPEALWEPHFFLMRITAPGFFILTGVIKLSHLPQSYGSTTRLQIHFCLGRTQEARARLSELLKEKAMCQDHLWDIWLHEISPLCKLSPPGSPGTGLRGATQTGEHHENCYYPALLERKSFRESWRPFLFRIWKVQKMNGKLK